MINGSIELIDSLTILQEESPELATKSKKVIEGEKEEEKEEKEKEKDE